MSTSSPITKITAEEIKDSRGNPTLKVTVFAGEYASSFSVPSGASTGAHEAHELRDPDGKGVKNAIKKVEEMIAPALVGKDVSNQKEIDKIMCDLDGTPNKKNLGGNSIIGVSIACAKTAAKVQGLQTFEYLGTLAEIKPSRKVPQLYMNLINGGKHAHNGLAFQEHMIVPQTFDVKEAVEIGVAVQNTLKEIIVRDLGVDSITLGDEGGFAPEVVDLRQPLFYLREALKENNLEDKVRLALDVAATSFYENGFYKVGGRELAALELLETYKSLVEEFALLSIEDPFHEEDFESFSKLNENHNLLVVGDDLTVSNSHLLKQAIDRKSIKALIIKPNQVGTLTETLETMKLARENDVELIVSHRSGETEDDFIADLAYAFGVYGLKAGSPQKVERMIKYRRLIEIANLKNI